MEELILDQDYYLTIFQNKNLRALEKNIQSDKLDISFTEATIFPNEFRFHFLKPYRELFNQSKKSFEVSSFENDLTFNYFFNFADRDLVSLSILPMLRIKHPYIGFYKRIREELIKYLLDRYENMYISKDTNSTIVIKSSFEDHEVYMFLKYSSLGFNITYHNNDSRIYFRPKIEGVLLSIIEELSMDLMFDILNKYKNNERLFSLEFSFEREGEILYRLEYGYILGKDKFFFEEENPEEIEVKSKNFHRGIRNDILSELKRNYFSRNKKLRDFLFYVYLEVVLKKYGPFEGILPDSKEFTREKYKRALYLYKKATDPKLLEEIEAFFE